jgi:hypothetical protein
MGEVAAHPGAQGEGVGRVALRRADARDVVDMGGDPVRHRHDAADAVLDAAELAAGEAHEEVGGAEAARQQEGQTRREGSSVRCHWRPSVRQQEPRAVVDLGLVGEFEPFGHRAAQPANALGVGLLGEAGVRAERQALAENPLVRRTRRLDDRRDMGAGPAGIDQPGRYDDVHGRPPSSHPHNNPDGVQFPSPPQPR